MGPRLTDWQVRLTRYVDGIVGEPFVWGVTDCAVIALRAYDVMFGTTEGAADWSTERQAIAAIKRRAIEDYLDALGAVEIEPGHAWAGDLYVEQGRHFPSLYVCLGRWCVTGNRDFGVILYPKPAAALPGVTVWRFPGA